MNNTVHHINSEEEYNRFKETQDKLIVVDFSAVWCPPCIKYAPVFEKLAGEFPGAVFIHVDIDDMEDMPDCSNVKMAPSFKFFKNGKLLAFQQGLNEHAVRDAILTFK